MRLLLSSMMGSVPHRWYLWRSCPEVKLLNSSREEESHTRAEKIEEIHANSFKIFTLNFILTNNEMRHINTVVFVGGWRINGQHRSWKSVFFYTKQLRVGLFRFEITIFASLRNSTHQIKSLLLCILYNQCVAQQLVLPSLSRHEEWWVIHV